MKREDIKAKLPDIPDDALDWLMAEYGKAANDAKTLRDKLKPYEGVDVQALTDKITTLETQLKEQAAAYAFDSALDDAIRARKGRSIKAVRGMLDLDALRASTDRDTDIAAALDAVQASDGWAFGEAATGATVSTGTEHGTGGTAQADGVMAKFASLNPDLKL